MVYYPISCAPIPEPFVWNCEFDVEDERINEEHRDLMQLINIATADIWQIDHVDAVCARCIEHFASEERLMDELLDCQESLLNEYYRSKVARSDSVSTFCSVNNAEVDGASSNSSQSIHSGRDANSSDEQTYQADHTSQFDPLFAAEIVLWAGNVTGEVTRVDLRDYALTDELVSAHRAKHAVFLEDCLIIRRRIQLAIQQREIQTEAKRWDQVGHAEIAFIKNWYTQHVKTEDMAIRHTKVLIARLRPLTARTQDLTRMLQKTSTPPEGQYDNLESPSRCRSEPDPNFVLAIQTSADPQIVTLRSWLAAIQLQAVCGLLILKPPGNSSKLIKTVLGSSAWAEMTGYEPWEVAGSQFAPFLSSPRANDIILSMQRLAMALTARVEEAGGERIQPSLMYSVSIHLKHGLRLPVLMVVLPVTLQSAFVRSEKLSLLVFFFSFPRDITSMDYVVPLWHLRQRPYFEHSCFGHLPDYKEYTRVETLTQDWRHVPLGNALFVFAFEAFCYGLIDDGFVVNEMGINVERHPSIAASLQQRAALLRLRLQARLGGREGLDTRVLHAQITHQPSNALGASDDSLLAAGGVNRGSSAFAGTDAGGEGPRGSPSIAHSRAMLERMRAIQRPAEADGVGGGRRSLLEDMGFRWGDVAAGKHKAKGKKGGKKRKHRRSSSAKKSGSAHHTVTTLQTEATSSKKKSVRSVSVGRANSLIHGDEL